MSLLTLSLLFHAVQFAAILWLTLSSYFDGRSHSEGFMMLSSDIIGNRDRISKLRSTCNNLEQRLWDVEKHTPEETLKRAESAMDEFASRVKGGDAN